MSRRSREARDDELVLRVRQRWLDSGRRPSTVQVYLCWVRRFRAYCRARGRRERELLSARGARAFAAAYARRRKCDQTEASRGALSALRAWSIGLQWLGHEVPLWKPPCRRKAQPRILEEFSSYRATHAGVADSTIANETYYIRQFISFMRRRSRRIRSVRIVDVDEFIELYTKDFALKTVAGVCSSLRAFLKFLHATGLLKHDLAASVVPPRMVARGGRSRGTTFDVCCVQSTFVRRLADAIARCSS